MKRLRWFDFITINLFWLGMNIRNTAVGSVFMPYLVDSFVNPAVKNTALGGMRTAGLIIAMLVQPAAGILSDRSTSRFGRRRPYIFVGTLFDLLFLTLIALSMGYWMLFMAILLLQISANVSHGPLQGLIPDIVPEDQRGRASAVKAIFELLPVIIVALTIAKLVAAGELGWAMAITGAALLVTMLLTVWLVKEKPLQEKPDIPLRGPMLRVLGMLAGIGIGALAGLLGGGLLGGLVGLVVWALAGSQTALLVGVGLAGLIAMVVAVVVGVWAGTLATLGQDARHHPAFSWWIVNRLFFLAAVTSIQGFAAFYLMSAFDISREAAIDMTASLFMVVGVCTLIAALPGGWLSDRIGRRVLVGGAAIVATIGTLVLLVTSLAPTLPLLYTAGIIIGLATGLFLTTNWALGTDLVPDAEAGRYLGISNLAGAGAGMIGAGIGGPIADLFNSYYPGSGYMVLFAYYAILFALSAVSLGLVRKQN